MCFYTGTDAVFGERTLDTVREKTKRAYMITRKKTRTVYEKIKKHKKLIIGIVTYLAFEGFGYAEGWDTPLRRLLRPKKLFDDANQTIQGHTAQVAKLTNAHQQAYKELERRYKELQRQLAEKEALEFERQKQSLLEEMEKFMNEK